MSIYGVVNPTARPENWHTRTEIDQSTVKIPGSLLYVKKIVLSSSFVNQSWDSFHLTKSKRQAPSNGPKKRHIQARSLYRRETHTPRAFLPRFRGLELQVATRANIRCFLEKTTDDNDVTNGREFSFAKNGIGYLWLFTAHLSNAWGVNTSPWIPRDSWRGSYWAIQVHHAQMDHGFPNTCADDKKVFVPLRFSPTSTRTLLFFFPQQSKEP